MAWEFAPRQHKAENSEATHQEFKGFKATALAHKLDLHCMWECPIFRNGHFRELAPERASKYYREEEAANPSWVADPPVPNAAHIQIFEETDLKTARRIKQRAGSPNCTKDCGHRQHRQTDEGSYVMTTTPTKTSLRELDLRPVLAATPERLSMILREEPNHQHLLRSGSQAGPVICGLYGKQLPPTEPSSSTRVGPIVTFVWRLIKHQRIPPRDACVGHMDEDIAYNKLQACARMDLRAMLYCLFKYPPFVTTAITAAALYICGVDRVPQEHRNYHYLGATLLPWSSSSSGPPKSPEQDTSLQDTAITTATARNEINKIAGNCDMQNKEACQAAQEQKQTAGAMTPPKGPLDGGNTNDEDHQSEASSADNTTESNLDPFRYDSQRYQAFEHSENERSAG
ncbi:hypothetical protein GGR53DRAFT_466426 [Hypoxylon sp. FL1150]|nr:hypothetical protein GGR53DRAFT_466426 [Hypoxylon sp. FL1150]